MRELDIVAKKAKKAEKYAKQCVKTYAKSMQKYAKSVTSMEKHKVIFKYECKSMTIKINAKVCNTCARVRKQARQGGGARRGGEKG